MAEKKYPISLKEVEPEYQELSARMNYDGSKYLPRILKKALTLEQARMSLELYASSEEIAATLDISKDEVAIFLAACAFVLAPAINESAKLIWPSTSSIASLTLTALHLIGIVFTSFLGIVSPFRSFYYYHPLQKGSASLKAVLPALTGKSYQGMGIDSGEDASIAFQTVTYGDVPQEVRSRVREDLEKYCSLDTEGMIWIVDKLKGIVSIADSGQS